MNKVDKISKKVVLTAKIRDRILGLHDQKVLQNQKKVSANGGAINIDDHGYIYFEGFKFTPDYPAGETVLHGCRCIGENLRKFFGEIPVYINENSGLAGAWAGIFQDKFARVGLCDSDQPTHLKELHKKYGITQSGIGGMNHMAPDMTIGLREGFTGILGKIRYYKTFINPADTDFYDGEEQLVLGILEYTKRHYDYALALSSQESDLDRKNNYQAIADSLSVVLTGAPKTFRDACQFMAIFQSFDRTYFGGGALGQLDELLRPYFENDIAHGALTEEEAVWLIASLLYNDTHYSQIGGLIPDGSRDVTSRLSFLILDATHYLHIPHNLAVRVHEGSNAELLSRAVDYILEDGSGVCFSLSKGIEEGFAKQGHPTELARMRAKVGCNWVALPGIEYPLQDVTRLNMALPLLYSLDEIMLSKQTSLDGLWTGFVAHLAIMVNCIKNGYDWHYEVVSRNTPEIVLNLFCHGPIERGVNCASGGVDIINLNCDGVALATVADSFAAIEQCVVIDQRFTWQQVYDAMQCDYVGHEEIRLALKNIPRFGAPNSLAEEWAQKIRDVYVSLVVSTKTPKHHLSVIPGLFSHGDVFAYGRDLPATPNGRKQGEPISHSSEPDPGFANGIVSFSPTLKANAVASVQPGYGNSAPLHLDIDSTMLAKAGGNSALCTLIRAHEQMGGTLLTSTVSARSRLCAPIKTPHLNQTWLYVSQDIRRFLHHSPVTIGSKLSTAT